MNSQADRKTTGMVFNIQKYSVHDGPGIRTIVFLKGCPLSCRWCSNPESQAFQAELAFNQGRCLGLAQCVRCVDACPHQAVSAAGTMPAFDREVCARCHRPCVEACPSKGVITYGEVRSVDDILRVVEQDAPFYVRSGGGLTLSGGEPLAQPGFAQALLREARRRRLSTAMETCGHVPWESLRDCAGLLDFIHYDLKCMDPARHREGTGASNERILDNLARLVEEFPALPVHVRTPLIPGFNDTQEDVRAICAFLSGMPGLTYEVLPYHRLGTQKYLFLDRTPPMGEAALDPDQAALLAETARRCMDKGQG